VNAVSEAARVAAASRPEAILGRRVMGLPLGIGVGLNGRDVYWSRHPGSWFKRFCG
jgi:hypothetical protein